MTHILIYHLLRLHLNDKHYLVVPPKREKISSEELTQLGDVKALVARVRIVINFIFISNVLFCVQKKLYDELHVSEHQIQKERQLHEKLEELNVKLGPLEKVATFHIFNCPYRNYNFCALQKRSELDLKACKKGNTLTWVGLGLMSVQFGVLARLTWWEYSWDVSSSIYHTTFVCNNVQFHIDHGTGNLFCYIWNCNGLLCLFRAYQTGE